MRNAPRRRRRNRIPEGQLALPLFEQLVDHGLRQIHHRPLVADDDRVIRGRRPPEEAWNDWGYVEANPAHTYAGMHFDIDDPDHWDYEVDGPTPNWIVRRTDPARGRTYHVAYTLDQPVARHDAARTGPLEFFRRVYDGLVVAFNADPRYSGFMTKNPIRPPGGAETFWVRREPYSLAELREWLPAAIPKPIIKTGVGRNCDLFYSLVKEAHQPRWARVIRAEGHAGQWLRHVRDANIANFAEDPLPDSECRSIAKSCAKYSLRNFSEATFSRIQAKRGAKRAQQRWHPDQPAYDSRSRSETVADISALGFSQAEIAEILGVTTRTIKRDLRARRLSARG